MRKPRHGAEGQSTAQSMGKGGTNRSGGGAMGQPLGTRNKPCKPAMGAQGQRLASSDRARGHSRPNAHRGGNDRTGA